MVNHLEERQSRFDRNGSTLPAVHGKPVKPHHFRVPSKKQKGDGGRPTSTSCSPTKKRQKDPSQYRARSVSAGKRRITERAAMAANQNVTNKVPPQRTTRTNNNSGEQRDDSEPNENAGQTVEAPRGGKIHETDRIRPMSEEGKRKRIEIYRGVKDARKKAAAAAKQQSPGDVNKKGKSIPQPVETTPPLIMTSSSMKRGETICETPKASNMTTPQRRQQPKRASALPNQLPPTGSAKSSRRDRVKSLSPRTDLPTAPSLWSKRPDAAGSVTVSPRVQSPSPSAKPRSTTPISPPHLRTLEETGIDFEKERKRRVATYDPNTGSILDGQPPIPTGAHDHFTPRSKKRHSDTLQRRAKSLERQRDRRLHAEKGAKNDRPRSKSAGRADKMNKKKTSAESPAAVVPLAAAYGGTARLSDKLQRAKRGERRRHEIPPRKDQQQGNTASDDIKKTAALEIIGASERDINIKLPSPRKQPPTAQETAARMAEQHRSVMRASISPRKQKKTPRSTDARKAPTHHNDESRRNTITMQHDAQGEMAVLPHQNTTQPSQKQPVDSPRKGPPHDSGRETLETKRSPRQASKASLGQYPRISVDSEDSVNIYYKKPDVQYQPTELGPAEKKLENDCCSKPSSTQISIETEQGNSNGELEKSMIASKTQSVAENETSKSPIAKPGNTPTKSDNTGTATNTDHRSPMYDAGQKAKGPITDGTIPAKSNLDDLEDSVFNFTSNSVDEKEKSEVGSSIFSSLSGNTNRSREPNDQKPKTNIVADQQEERLEVEFEYASQESPSTVADKKKFTIRNIFPSKGAKNTPESTRQEEGTPRMKIWTPALKNVMGQRTPKEPKGEDEDGADTPRKKSWTPAFKNVIGQRAHQEAEREAGTPHRRLWTPSFKNMIGQRSPHVTGEGDKTPCRKMWTPAFRNMKVPRTPFFGKDKSKMEDTVNQAITGGERETESSPENSRDSAVRNQEPADQKDPAVFKFHQTQSKEEQAKSSREDDLSKKPSNTYSHGKPPNSSPVAADTYPLQAVPTQESNGSTLFGANKLCLCGPNKTLLSTEEDVIPYCRPIKTCIDTVEPSDQVKTNMMMGVEDRDDYSAASSRGSVCVLSDSGRKDNDIHVSFSETIDIQTIDSEGSLTDVARTSKRKKNETEIRETALLANMSRDSQDSQRSSGSRPPRPPLPPLPKGTLNTNTNKPKKTIIPPIAFRKQRFPSNNSREPSYSSNNNSSRNVVTSSSFTHTGVEQVETLLRVPEMETSPVSSKILASICENSTTSIDADVYGTVFNVRISLAFLSGLMTTVYKRQKKRGITSPVTAYAHVDFSSSIATQASKTAVSVPISLDYYEGQTPLPPIVWSGGAAASKTRGRLYFSVVLENQKGHDAPNSFSPETVCLVVGVKSGNETIPLGLVSFTIDGAEVHGKRVNFAVQPDFVEEEETPEKGVFNLRRKRPKTAFRRGDHMYALDSSAVLSARVDVTNGVPGAPGPSVWNDMEGDADSFIHSVLPSTEISKAQGRVHQPRGYHAQSYRKPRSRLSRSKEKSNRPFNVPPANSASDDSIVPKTMHGDSKTKVIGISTGKKWKWANRGQDLVRQQPSNKQLQVQVKQAKKSSFRKTLLPPFMRVVNRKQNGSSLGEGPSIAAHSRHSHENEFPYTPDNSLTVATNFSFTRPGGYLNNRSSSSSYTDDCSTERKEVADEAASWIYNRAKAVGLFSESSDEDGRISEFSFTTKTDTQMQTSDLSESCATSVGESTTTASERGSRRNSRLFPSRYSRSQDSRGSRTYGSRTASGTGTLNTTSRDETFASTQGSKDTLDEFRKILWIANKLSLKPDELIDRLKAGEDIGGLLHASF